MKIQELKEKQNKKSPMTFSLAGLLLLLMLSKGLCVTHT